MTSILQGASPIPKTATGIPGFDHIGFGGLPTGRSTLIAGTAGSGKTIFALQFLVAGVRYFSEHGVLVTFEESADDIVANARTFGWNLQAKIDAGQIAVIDATPDPMVTTHEVGMFDLSGLVVRIQQAVKAVNARRVTLDSIGALFPQFRDANIVRRDLHRIAAALRSQGITTLITMERATEDGPIGRFGIEEFVVDNVLIMRNRLEREKRRRTVEILKYRGTPHQKGEFPFTIDARDGVTLIPLSATELKQKSSDIRVSSGIAELDRMCGGGLYKNSVILVSGATGTGKTLMVTEFIRAAIQRNERALLIGSEESADQLSRNAAAWGVDFEKAARANLLRMNCRYPEVMGLEDHLLQIKRDIDEFRPIRIAIDSMSAFERVGSNHSFREFVVGLTSYIKHLEITGLVTNTTTMSGAVDSVTENHISTITDTIVMLRYVELHGEMRRGLTVLKMRGTWHEKEIREYVIDGQGMRIGKPFRGVHGILTGMPTYGYGQAEGDVAQQENETPVPLNR